MKELCLITPDSVPFKGPSSKQHRLLLQNNGELFFCDKEDWEKAKHILWWYNADIGEPVNKVGIPFTEYVGITGSRLTSGVEKYNFCRVCYV